MNSGKCKWLRGDDGFAVLGVAKGVSENTLFYYGNWFICKY